MYRHKIIMATQDNCSSNISGEKRNPFSVSDERLEKIKQLGIQVATGGDPIKIEALKRKALLRSQVIDVPPQNNEY